MIARPLNPVRDADALASELRSCALALLDDALEHAREPARSGEAKGVHEIRKRIKELRALLRLAGDAIVDADRQPVRRRANQELRSTARLLSESRDAEVMLRTLDELAGQERESPTLAAIELRARLADRPGEERAAPPFAAVREALELIRAEAADWQVACAGECRDEDAWSVLAPNLRRIFRRARRSMRAAQQASEAETWHTWRRRMKDLRYVLELLRMSAPEMMSPQIKVSKQVTEALGMDHDLAVLMSFAQSESPAEAGSLVAAVQVRGEKLRREALRDAQVLLAERPRAFVRRIGSYWHSASAPC